MPSLSSKKTAANGAKITLGEVKALGTDLLSSREHINNLPRLLRLLSPSSPRQHLLESLVSLHPFFITLLPEIPSRTRSKPPALRPNEKRDPNDVYCEWIRNRFDEFLDSLILIASSLQTDDAILEVVLDVIMELVQKGKGGKFESAIYHRFMHSLIYAISTADNLLNLLADKFFKYADVRYYTYTSLSKIACKCEKREEIDDENTSNKYIKEAGVEAFIRSIFTLLSRISSFERSDEKNTYEMWSKSDAGLLINQLEKRLKMKLTAAWRSFLQLQHPMDVYKEVLGNLHQLVIPNVTNPMFLCDFLTRSYDIGGVISVMALSGLYILITQHGIEYPKYYNKLYALLTPTVFMAKYRARFFQLLDSSLKSNYVPAYLAAAFAKKLSRLALTASPSSALVIIAIIHNLLRRHPSINFLVHQAPGERMQEDASGEVNHSEEVSSEEKNGQIVSSSAKGIDPFQVDESDPVKSEAMRSSLWEIDTLRQHYCPAVSRFVASLENDLTIRNKTSEVAVSDFASGSYATVFGSEIRCRIKQVPLAFYRSAPTVLFSETDFAGWSFGGMDCCIEVKDDSQKSNEEAFEHQEAKRQKLVCP